MKTKETNFQKVNFQLSGQWYESTIDLKRVYTTIHSSAKYGASANKLVNEMLSNLLELCLQRKICLTSSLTITDYGCGQSKATNILAKIVAENSEKLSSWIANGKSINQILSQLSEEIKKEDAKEISTLPTVCNYKNITVQRYDIGIPEYSTKPNSADVVFCNDVFEHIPENELPSFLEGLEEAGKYIFASISLRDAVNYKAIPEEMLWEKAKKVISPTTGIILSKDPSGDYIFSLHVSVFSKHKWQKILGEKWTLLPAQDYTAVSALNFKPTEEYCSSKKELVTRFGFADFIPFPTKRGSRYETDPILWRRTALMQPQKHIQKLNVLEEYPESAFKTKEMQESFGFFNYIGAKIKKENGSWIIEKLPEFLSKMRELENICKTGNSSDSEVAEKASKILLGI